MYKNVDVNLKEMKVGVEINKSPYISFRKGIRYLSSILLIGGLIGISEPCFADTGLEDARISEIKKLGFSEYVEQKIKEIKKEESSKKIQKNQLKIYEEQLSESISQIFVEMQKEPYDVYSEDARIPEIKRMGLSAYVKNKMDETQSKIHTKPVSVSEKIEPIDIDLKPETGHENFIQKFLKFVVNKGPYIFLAKQIYDHFNEPDLLVPPPTTQTERTGGPVD